MNIRLKKRGAPYGVKVPERKYSERSPIEPAPRPEKAVLPLQQNIGAPATALVKRGDKVLTGQKVAECDKFVSAPVHASVSGEIAGTTMLVNPPTGQLVEALIINADGEDNWIELEKPSDPGSLSVKELLNRIREAGIVGLGGATFPSQVKLSPPPDKKIETVILNGCECEPYVTSDHRVMLEYGKEVLSGLGIIRKILSPRETYIAIEDNKENAIANMERLISSLGLENDFKVAPLRSKYPMGAEKTLIKTILNREVPIGGLPMDVGAVIQNVGTAKAIHDAVYEGIPLIERVVTVTGMVESPKNLLTRFGTPIRTLIDYCGGMGDGANAVILGGPMMGMAQFDLDFPVIKGTNSILVKEDNPVQEQDCISCGKCQATPERANFCALDG